MTGAGSIPRAARRAIEKGLIDADARGRHVRHRGLRADLPARLLDGGGGLGPVGPRRRDGRGAQHDRTRRRPRRAVLAHGEGTAIEISLPLSMAVTRLMTVACGERLFGVPMGLVIGDGARAARRLRRIGEGEAFVLRDRVVPLLRLGRLLDLPETGAACREDEAILVVRVGGERLGLVVGAFRDVMEAIVKPLEGVLAGLPASRAPRCWATDACC
jgi:two-component system, chemotaxis family, sensor kinase CheA